MQLHQFTTRDEASHAAAQQIATRLQQRLDADAAASLVIPGGSTPAACFAELSRASLDWQAIEIWLSDERWVEPTSDDSNEKLARENLLTNAAAPARLIPVYSDTLLIETRCAQLDTDLRARARPFAACLLGMGSDGHFASLFPDLANLADALDVTQNPRCIPVQTEASPLPRVSLTLAALAHSDEILLLVFGEDKRLVFEDALQAAGKYPVSSLLALTQPPVTIYWAP